jgi:hypothetical protein
LLEILRISACVGCGERSEPHRSQKNRESRVRWTVPAGHRILRLRVAVDKNTSPYLGNGAQRSRWPQSKENHPQIAQMYADKECKAAMISSLFSYPFNLRHLRY